jgi:hypothetical protein
VSKTVKVSKDYVEKVITEDLKKKYPDITDLEFRSVLYFHQYEKWIAMGVFSTSKEFNKAFAYIIDGETGEILGFIIST